MSRRHPDWAVSLLGWVLLAAAALWVVMLLAAGAGKVWHWLQAWWG